MDTSLEGERKQVTIIFADISGFTALNDAAKTPGEVEAVVRLINSLLKTLSEAIYEFDGHIDKYIGDEIMAIFGAPTAHEDDPERALRAVLSMQERLEKFNQNPPMPLPEPLGIHGGVSTGTVIAGWFGTERTRSYTVMGDAVNVASRLESVSERGEFLVSESTHNLVGHLFDWEEREPVKVKGKRDPLNIYDLKGITSGGQPKPPEAPIIGREYELDILMKQRNKLLEDAGGIVVVTAEAGLGKSRLISEFRKQAEGQEHEAGLLWLFGRGVSYRQAFKNRLFVDILHRYLDLPENPDDALVKLRLEDMGKKLFGRQQDEIVPYLGALLGISIDEDSMIGLPLDDPQVLQQRTLLAVGQWIEALAIQKPVVLVFEDLHWADPSSVDLIEYLFHLTTHHPILMVCATRPERESHFWTVKSSSSRHYKDHFTELTLWPLTDEESRRLIQHQLKIDKMPAEIEQLILSRAEGNPLFLEEVLRSLIEEGAIVHAEDGHWQITRSAREIDIPNTLQGVLFARIDRLNNEVKEILQVAAVIGRVFPHFILAPNVEKPAEVLDEALKQLEAADLIQKHRPDPEPEYIFKHMLTYEIVYSGLLHEQRKAIHKRIADFMAFKVFWMLGEEYAPIVADHYEKSETWPRAMRYLQRAAEAAIQSFANNEAVTFYTKTLEVAERIGQDADQNAVMTTYQGRARILARLGDPQGAIADYEVMLAKAKTLGDDSTQMRALNGLGSLHTTHSSFPKASQFFHDALAVARRIGDELGTADTLNQLGHFYTNIGEFKKGVTSFQEAREISITLQDESRRIEAEDGLAKIMLEQGQIEASLKRYEDEIITVRQRLGFRGGLMSSLSNLLMAQTYAADYKGADETVAQVLEIQQRSGDLYRVPIVKYYQAIGQTHQGELGAAAENLEEGLRIAREQREKSSQILGLTWMSYYYLSIGLNEEGLHKAEEATKIAQEMGSPLHELRAQLMLGTAYRHLKRSDEAIPLLTTVYEDAGRMGLTVDKIMLLYQLARAYIDTDRWPQVAEMTRQLLTLATASGLQEYIVRGQWLQSLVDIYYERYNAALDVLIEASNLAEEIDSRLSQYLIQIQKSYVYHKAGNDAASRDAVIYAQKIQKRLTDSFPDETLQQIFLNNLHSRHLAEMVEANIGSQVKAVVHSGDDGR